MASMAPQSAFAQNAEELADRLADEALAGETAADPAESADGAAAGSATPGAAPSANILRLMFKGGWLMVPILVMSVVVVAFGIERGLGLRRDKIIPHELVQALGQASPQGGFDPRKAYRICQQFPSSAASIIKAMLLKVGRPHAEVEHAVAEASEREAARLYTNVRTLNLAAAVSPLLGLLGTVWGMIQAFFATANLPTGANKAELLAEGIYVALVTTFAGLAVAIPAAVLAHHYEGRIQSLIREVDELLFNLMPQVERFEGKLRVSRQHFGEGAKEEEEVVNS